MKRFADSIARQKGIKPPPGYTKSGSICRTFLNQYAPKKADGEATGQAGSKPASVAQISFAEKIAQNKGIIIPDEAKASTAAMSAWIGSNLDNERGKSGRKTASKPRRSTAPKTKKRGRKRTAVNATSPASPTLAQQNLAPGTALKIPYGNKESALNLGARYRSGRWYAPPGVDLDAFSERGWL